MFPRLRPGPSGLQAGGTVMRDGPSSAVCQAPGRSRELVISQRAIRLQALRFHRRLRRLNLQALQMCGLEVLSCW